MSTSTYTDCCTVCPGLAKKIRRPGFCSFAPVGQLASRCRVGGVLESLNFAGGANAVSADDGLVEELLPLQIDQALDAAEAGSGFEGFDYHLAEALDEEEMSDHCSSSSEEDENNEAVS